MTELELEEIFGAVRRERPVPPHDLIARIAGDAEAEHQRRLGAVKVASAPLARRSWPGWFGALGGTGAVAGLLTATLVGLWLGFAQPVPVTAFTQSLEDVIGTASDTDQIELIPALDPFSLEG